MLHEQHKSQVRERFVDAKVAACLGICPGFVNLTCSPVDVELLDSGGEQGDNMPDQDPYFLAVSMEHVPVHG